MLLHSTHDVIGALQEYTVKAGSQLVAVFEDTSDVLAVREMVDKLVFAMLGTPSAADVDVCLGCLVVYITFKLGGLSGLDDIANGLKAEGAQLTLVIDKESDTSFLASEPLRGAYVMRVCAQVLLWVTLQVVFVVRRGHWQ